MTEVYRPEGSPTGDYAGEVRDALVFSVLRILLIVACYAALRLIGLGPMLALVAGAVIALLLSMLFLRPQRQRVVDRWQERSARVEHRPAAEDEDAAAEDEALGPGADPRREGPRRAGSGRRTPHQEDPRRLE